MNSDYYHIGNAELLITLGLMGIVLVLNYVEKVKLEKDIIVGTLRCFAQLMIVGYILQAIFGADKWYWVVLAVLVMTLVGGFESVRRQEKKGPYSFYIAIGTILVATVFVMGITILLVVKVKPWYNPQYIIPMMGMLIGNAMNGASLVFNRLHSELDANREMIEAKLSLGATAKTAVRGHLKESIKAGMIPTLNYLMVIGIVALPGMMTGQIIAGASPMDSVRYQIAIMYMISVSNALTVFASGILAYRQFFTRDHQLKSELL